MRPKTASLFFAVFDKSTSSHSDENPSKTRANCHEARGRRRCPDAQSILRWQRFAGLLSAPQLRTIQSGAPDIRGLARAQSLFPAADHHSHAPKMNLFRRWPTANHGV